MPKKLYLIRHAHSLPADLSMRDFDRPLSPNGQRDATHVGMYLSDQQIVPDVFLCSTAVRTRETAAAITHQIKFEDNRIQFQDELYEPSVREMMRIINELPSDASSVILVSHNPAITYLGEYLSGAAIGNMAPASLVEIEFEIDDWSEIIQGSGTFKNHIIADLL